MGRPRIYDTPHFCLHTYVRKGHTYVEAYRNEWDPEKKRSRIAQRKYVGALDTETGRVRLGKKYLSENPQYEGKILYYEDKQLVERTPEEVQEELMNKLMASDYVDYENEMAVKFQQAILMLPEKQRVVFNLRYYDELEYEEISRITDTKVDTLKVNYHYAKEKIKEYMINN